MNKIKSARLLTIISVCFMQLLISINSLAQSGEISYDFGKFTIDLPEDVVYREYEDGSDAYLSDSTGIIFSTSYFEIEEDFDVEEALYFTMLGEFGIGPEETDAYIVKTSTDTPLFCTLGEWEENAVVYGMYPDYDSNICVEFCGISTTNNVSDLIRLTSSFRVNLLNNSK